jgi:hypothetical protein
MMCPKRQFAVIVAVHVLLISARCVFSAYPLATDDAGTVKVGGYEFEAGYDNCRDENDLINRNCGVSLKHGVTEKMDIGISFPYQVDPAKNENMGEASFSLKFTLIKDMVAVTFTNEVGEKDYFINAIYSKEFSFIKFNVNAGYSSTGDETAKGAGSYGASAEFPVKKFEIIGEVQGQECGKGNGLAGIRYRITDAFFVAAGASKVFAMDENKLTGGFHFEF